MTWGDRLSIHGHLRESGEPTISIVADVKAPEPSQRRKPQSGDEQRRPNW